MSSEQSAARQSVLTLLAFFVFVFTLFHFFGPTLQTSQTVLPGASINKTLPRYWSVTGKSVLEGVTDFVKPPGLKVVAIIFYGRPESISVLDCYLKRNLAENGGILDEVVFIARTKRMKDLAWLDGLVETSPSYRRQNITWKDGDYRSSYDLVQNGTMYIKMDDDVVFIEDTAIPSLVETRLKNPEFFTVSANIINQPSLSWVHEHLGVMRPYLPELEPPPGFDHSNIFKVKDFNFSSTGDWRASKLPNWDGPLDFNYTEFFEEHPNGAYPGHRWLPVRQNWNDDETPITEARYDAFGPSLWHWYDGAQQHYSFLEHLENNDIWRYKFHRWDYNYARMGIQFIAMMGDDINRSKPMKETDDEYFFSEVMPQKTKRHAIIDGRGLVAHYRFSPQRDGLASTDLLDRYRAFATEKICTS